MEEMILCEAMFDAGFPAKVMHYQYADQKKDKNGNVIREKMQITKGRKYLVNKRLVEGCERNHKKSKGQPGAYGNYSKLLWKRVAK